MSVHQFRNINIHTLRGWFEPRKPRNALLRFVLGVAGLALLAVLIVAGLVIGSVMLVANLLLRLLRPGARPMAKPRAAEHVVEGEYSVIQKSALPTGR